MNGFVEHFEQYVNDSTCLFTHCLSLQSIDQYVLLVKASDLNGAAGCNVATGTVTITINDVNDNVPTLQGPVRKYLHFVYIHMVLVCCCSEYVLIRFFILHSLTPVLRKIQRKWR